MVVLMMLMVVMVVGIVGTIVWNSTIRVAPLVAHITHTFRKCFFFRFLSASSTLSRFQEVIFSEFLYSSIQYLGTTCLAKNDRLSKSTGLIRYQGKFGLEFSFFHPGTLWGD